MHKQKKKVEKIQLFGQEEAFYSGNDFVYPHCMTIVLSKR